MQLIVRNQKGFTLVELAIVLVIIGLILGGVLKGQEMIENAKSKRGINDLNAAIAGYYSYLDRYGRIPGDDGPLNTLTARGGNWASVTQAGNNNGLLNITAAQTFNGGGENDNFWQHVRAANFLTGDPALAGAAALPKNAFGGLIGVTNESVMGGLNGNKLCMSEVPGKSAAAIDTQLDDGKPNTGSIRSTLGTAGANTVPGGAATAYVETDVYTICRTI